MGFFTLLEQFYHFLSVFFVFPGQIVFALSILSLSKLGKMPPRKEEDDKDELGNRQLLHPPPIVVQ